MPDEATCLSFRPTLSGRRLCKDPSCFGRMGFSWQRRLESTRPWAQWLSIHVGSDGTAGADRSIGERHARLGAAVGIPLSIVLIWLAARGIDPHGLWQAIVDANPLLIALGGGAIAVIYAIQAARWRRIALETGDLPWRTFLRMVIASVAVNNVIPGRPGELARGYWLARSARVAQGRALSTVFIDRSCDVIVLAAALAVTYPFVPHHAWLHRVLLAGAALGAALVLLVVGARLWVAMGGSSSRWYRMRGSWVGRQTYALTHGTATAANRRTLAIAYALTVVSWCAWALAAWLVARSIGIHLSAVEVVFVTTVINLGAAVPSSPGFIGTFQWLSVASLGVFGVGRTSAFAFSILMHAIWYIPTTIAGGVLVVRSGLSWRRSAAPEPPAAVPASYAAHDRG
jgi:glycosyltransferase 2 family protein